MLDRQLQYSVSRQTHLQISVQSLSPPQSAIHRRKQAMSFVVGVVGVPVETRSTASSLTAAGVLTAASSCELTGTDSTAQATRNMVAKLKSQRDRCIEPPFDVDSRAAHESRIARQRDGICAIWR
jgi:hypothetical protein